MLPIELAHWQWGYIVLSILSACFLVIAMMQVLGNREPRYSSVVGYGCILVCVGVASILINFNVVDICLNSFGGGLLSQSMALMFSIMMVMWVVLIVVSALYLANQLKIFDTQNIAQLYLTLLPIVLIMILVVRFANIELHSKSVALLREIIFLIVPAITIISCAISMFARKITDI
jgi:hypothetical protein